MFAMDAAAGAVSFDAAVGGSAREILTACGFHDRFVQGLPLPPIVLAEVHANHLRGASQLHDRSSFAPPVDANRCVYLITSTSERTTSPSCIISSRIGRYA